MILTELKNIKAGKKNLRQFVVLWFLVLSGIGIWQFTQGKSEWIVFCGLGLGIGGFGWFWPFLFKPFYFVWMGLAVLLGAVVSRVVLVVTFYGLITPMSVLFRLFGKGVIQNKQSESYWIARDDFSSKPEKYERQF